MQIGRHGWEAGRQQSHPVVTSHQSEQQWRFLMPHCLARPELALATAGRVCFPHQQLGDQRALLRPRAEPDHHLHRRPRVLARWIGLRGQKARTSTSTSAADIEAPRGNAPARLKNFFGKYPKWGGVAFAHCRPRDVCDGRWSDASDRRLTGGTGPGGAATAALAAEWDDAAGADIAA